MSINDIRRRQLFDLLRSLVNDYKYLLSDDDLKLISDISINGLGNHLKELEKLVSNVWKWELESNQYKVISWNKATIEPDRDKLVFATISTADNIIPFCDASDGIEYEISYDAILGACPRDGATIPVSKADDYTIAVIDGQAYSSYNGATRLITPKQLVKLDDSNYHTYYNELILDSTKVKPLGAFSRKK